MSEKTLGRLLLCLHILCTSFMAANAVKVPFASNSKYTNCNHVFKNRVAFFEYKYYPGYWVYPAKVDSGEIAAAATAAVLFPPSAPGLALIDYESTLLRLDYATPSQVKSYDSDYAWARWGTSEMPDGDGLAVETHRKGWKHHYMTSGAAYLGGKAYEVQFASSITDLDKKHKVYIYCANKCKPSYGDDQYDDCVIGFKNEFLYFNKQSHAKTVAADADKSSWDGYNNWFQFRVFAPPTDVAWQEASDVKNCNTNADPLPSSFTAKSSVSLTQSHSHTITAEQKLSFDIYAKLNKIGSSESTISYSWTTENIKNMVDERTLQVGSAGGNTKTVKPGKRWKIFQATGTVGYWKLKTLKLMSCDCDCGAKCTPSGSGCYDAGE